MVRQIYPLKVDVKEHFSWIDMKGLIDIKKNKAIDKLTSER